MRKSFIIHKDSIAVLKDLTDEQAGQLFKAIAAYQNSETYELSGLMKAIFTPFKNQFDRDNESYQNIVERNRANGLTGGRPPKPKETKHNLKNQVGYLDNPSEPKKADSDSDSKNKSKSKNRNNKTFIAPKLFEVIEYFTGNGYTEQSATKAFNYYDVANWKDSNDKQVKNWKQKMQSVWFTDENKSKAEIKTDGTDPNFISPNGLKGIFTIEKKSEKLWFRRYPHLRQYELTIDGGITWDKRDVL